MDIISISSDSDTSESEILKRNSYPSNWEDEVYNVEWNDDNYPGIDYESDPVKSENENSFELGEKIEDFITPGKQVNSVDKDEIVNNADETVNYIEGIECSKSTNLKTKTSSDLLTSDFSNKCSQGDRDDCEIQSSSQQIRQSRQKLSQEEKNMIKEQKEKLKEEKKAEQLKQKALKAAFMENYKNLKPEENIKFLKVHIDNGIINSVCGSNIIPVLQQNNIQYAVEAQINSHTIIWSKRKIEKVLNEFDEIEDKIENNEEEQLVYVLDWEKAVQLVHNNELLSHVETVKSAYIDKKMTLVIFGLGKYFEYRKNKRNRDMKAEINDKKKSKPKPCEKVFEDAPSISKDQLEFALSDLQLLGKHNCRLLETPEELSFFVFNFTKSLSQVDLKLEKQKRQGSLEWFGPADSQCVKVDKNGNGLLRLWQQQICQFSSVGFDTAQAVVSHFGSPLALTTEYEKQGSGEESEMLLQNIQIRRGTGILSSSRRVGPQLSRKIYKFFTADDPDIEL